MTNKDYYQILGILKDADNRQIKAAYRDLAFKYHPDKSKDDPDAIDRMKQVNEAYAVLSDSKKKHDYDSIRQQYGSTDAYTQFRQRYSDQDIFTGTDIHTVFNEIAKSFGFRNFNDIFQDLHTTKRKDFEFKGSNFFFKGFFFFGKMDIKKLPFKNILTGKVEEIARTLLQNISGKNISLQGKDLHDTIQINSDLATKGGAYAYYHTWKTKKLVVKIPPNVRHGQLIRLKGMGENNSDGKPGDLYLRIEAKQSIVSKIKKYLPF